MSIVQMVVTVASGLLLVVVGVFSLLSLLWGDLLEGKGSSRPEELSRRLA